MLLNADHICFGYGEHQIFNDLTFSVSEHQKLGLIGQNGSGKTTLFKLITHELSPDSGNMYYHSSIQIGYLKQEQIFNSDLTLHEVFLSYFQSLIELEQEMNQLQKTIDCTDGEEQESAVLKLGELQETYKNNGGYAYPSRIRGVVAGLGFNDDDLKRKINTFSSGQRTRIALGSLLLQEPDLLLLDEPTNYLDIRSLNWLESYLKNYPNTFIVISHDRYLLDCVCTSISEIRNKKLLHFEGNYTSYLSKKKKHDQAEQKKFEQIQKEIDREEAIISKLRGNFTTKNTKRAKSREKKLEKIKSDYSSSHYHYPSEKHDFHFSLSPSVRSSDDVLKIKHLSKSFDQLSLYSDLNIDVFRGDRIGIIGPNGTGKSTLLKIIKRELLPDTGRLVFGENVHIGYYSQEADDTLSNHSETLIDALRTVNIKLSDGEIRNILAQFMFRNDEVFKTVNELSGGEKSRLRLAMLMISQANLLLLDEPTNHIDMDTKEILENALLNYEGTIITVSHDRYFLNKIATRILSISQNQILDIPGNYDDYLMYCSTHQNSQEKKSSPVHTEKQQNNKNQHAIQKQIRNQKKELQKIEDQIDMLSKQVKQIEAEMNQPQFYDNQKTADQKIADYSQLKEQISKLTDQWEDLAIKLDRI